MTFSTTKDCSKETDTLQHNLEVVKSYETITTIQPAKESITTMMKHAVETPVIHHVSKHPKQIKPPTVVHQPQPVFPVDNPEVDTPEVNTPEIDTQVFDTPPEADTLDLSLPTSLSSPTDTSKDATSVINGYESITTTDESSTNNTEKIIAGVMASLILLILLGFLFLKRRKYRRQIHQIKLSQIPPSKSTSDTMQSNGGRQTSVQSSTQDRYMTLDSSQIQYTINRERETVRIGSYGGGIYSAYKSNTLKSNGGNGNPNTRSVELVDFERDSGRIGSLYTVASGRH